MQLPEEAVTRFEEAMQAAEAAGEIEPTAMCLSTRGEDGGVSARMVLLKEFTPRGFVFYTNLESIKGRQLAARPVAALVFHWKTLERQVRVEGRAEPVSDAEADAYFASRPRGSQLGAWASAQSRPLSGRAELLKQVAKAEARYFGGEVPRPPHWSGFRIQPRLIEYWQDGAFRLHDRLVYHREADGWRTERLFP